MVVQVVWVSGQSVSRFDNFTEAVKAFAFHYRRVILGAQSGMA